MTHHSLPTKVAPAFLVSFSLTGPALAWGYEGHRIVAEIAEQYLEPETPRQVRELLALENTTTLAEVSTWADDMRDVRRETARWPYVNIPIHPPAGTPARYDADRGCPRGDCVVAAIDRFAAVLRDRDAEPRDRLEALKFVVHLVADLQAHRPRAGSSRARGRGRKQAFPSDWRTHRRGSLFCVCARHGIFPSWVRAVTTMPI